MKIIINSKYEKDKLVKLIKYFIIFLIPYITVGCILYART